MKLENISQKEAIKLINKVDKERASYYNFYTNENWGEKDGYDLCIDTSKIGVENTTELIENYINMKSIKEEAKI